MSTQPDSTPAATAEALDKGVGCDALLAGLRTLALRAYPELKSSRICSRHRDQGHYECTICYPDWHALLSEHMRVSGELYDQLLALSGLRDPDNGRIGTSAIVAELRRKLSSANTEVRHARANVEPKPER